MTTDIAPAATRTTYGSFWRSMPRELLYLLVAWPLAITGFGITVGLFSSGVGTLAVFLFGVFLIIAALYVARGFGTLQVVLLEWVARKPIPRPEWQDARAATGFLGWLRALLGNGHYWLYLLHTMVIDFIVATVTWTITIVWLSVGLGGVTYWFWNWVFPYSNQDWFLSRWLFPAANFDPYLVEGILYAAVGVVFLLTLPFVTRGLARLHWLIARGLLSSFKSDALLKQVETLTESRGAAQSAEGHSLRRLERDIHDGPQQRLVRLQMDLAAAERQLDSNPEKARALITEAMDQSKEALDELRALSRGFAPPILLDRGLVAALESAAARSTVTTRVVNELPEGTSLPQEIERNAYFVASEALANAAKHSGATQLDVTVSLVDGSLTLAVVDDGMGGAVPTDGHGLAGLQERLRGLGGTLTVLSPEGGPTEITATLPVSD